MTIELGHISELTRYPVKSMAGTPTESAFLGLHGPAGTAAQDARTLKSAVRLNANNAGVYGTVVQTGTIAVGQAVRLVRDARR